MNEAIAALESYGFVLEDEGYVKRGGQGAPKTLYVPVVGGFNRFERRNEQWQQYPYTIHPEWAGVSGLVFDGGHGAGKVAPQCFETVYPAEEIAKVYAPQPEQE